MSAIDDAMSWSIGLAGSPYTFCNYAPTNRVLTVYNAVTQTYSAVPNQPITITNTILNAADPQGFIANYLL
jgi:hypothetical protein